MVKRFMVAVLVLLIACGSIGAYADTSGLDTKAIHVKSKTTGDLSSVAGMKSESGVELPPEFVVEVKTQTEEASAMLTEIFTFVTEQKMPVVSFFNEEVVSEIRAALPEGVDLDSLSMDEFAPLGAISYNGEYGDVAVTFQFATEYVDGQNIVALVGISSGLDEAGNQTVEWHALKAEVVDGLVVVHFTTEVLLKMEQSEAMIAILSEDIADTAN